MEKIIVCDLDGTLLTNTKGKVSVSKKNVEKIHLWQKNNYFTVATGRNIHEVIEILEEAKIVPYSYLICSNGAVIYDYQNKKVVYEDKMSIDFTLAILNYFRTNDIGFVSMSTNKDSYNINKETDEAKFKEILKKVHDNKINKVGYYFKGQDIKNIYEDLKRLPGVDQVNLIFSSDTYLDIQNKKTSKGNALKEIVKLNNNLKTYVIGDFHNDLELLLNADVSFAPKDGAEEIKAVAQFLVGNHHEDAVAEMIDKIIEENL